MKDANSDLDPEELDHNSSLYKKGKEGDREAAKELIASTINDRYTFLFAWAKAGDPEAALILMVEELADPATLITLAEAGDPEAAKQLMRDAVSYLGHDQPLPNSLLDYIQEALYKAAQGVDANRAFHLKKGVGKNKYTPAFERLLTYMEVQLALRKGGTKTAAYESVAKTDNLASETIRKRCRRSGLDWIFDQWPEEELQSGIAACQRILKNRHGTT
ncbi:MAG: hypothetical protein IIC60_13760 [Proteobacteria bacterium]|nr:hypothetical protein [Pseudomonadota bacterium]